jgi:hypothetical protein
VRVPSAPEGATDVGLAISVSSEVQAAHCASVLPVGAPVFEVRTKQTALDSLRHPDDLRAFSQAVQQVMEAIHRTTAKRIHLFAGVPVAAAVQFGRR